jgi:hypothetical protein
MVIGSESPEGASRTKRIWKTVAVDEAAAANVDVMNQLATSGMSVFINETC